MPSLKQADAIQSVARMGYAALNAKASKSKMLREQLQVEEAAQLNEALSALHMARLSETQARFRYTRPNIFVGPSMPRSLNGGGEYAQAPGSYPSEIPIGADMGMVRLAHALPQLKEAGLMSSAAKALPGLGQKIRGAVSTGLSKFKAPSVASTAAAATPSIGGALNAGVPASRAMVHVPKPSVASTAARASTPSVAAPSPWAQGAGATPSVAKPNTAAATPSVAPAAPAPVPAATPAAGSPTWGERKDKFYKGLGRAGTGLGIGVAGLGIAGAYGLGKVTDSATKLMSQESGPAVYGPAAYGGYNIRQSPSPYGYNG